MSTTLPAHPKNPITNPNHHRHHGRMAFFWLVGFCPYGCMKWLGHNPSIDTWEWYIQVSPGEVRTWAGSADGRNNGTCSATSTHGLPFSSTAVLVASRVATSGVYTSWACCQIWICHRNALHFSRTSAFCFDVFAFLLERSSHNWDLVFLLFVQYWTLRISNLLLFLEFEAPC